MEQVPIHEEDDDDRPHDALELRALALPEDVGSPLLQQQRTLQ